MIPYTALKQVIRFANPAAVMSGVLDLFLAQPFGSKSLAQRVFGMAINDGIKNLQKTIDSLAAKIGDQVLCEKLSKFCESDEQIKNEIRSEAAVEDIDLVVAILRSDNISPELSPEQVGKVFNAFVAWNHAVEHVDEEMRSGTALFSQLKQLLKLYTRQRDKAQMLAVIQEPVTLQLFRDLFTIFYEPLVRVYKSANVYSSVTDFAAFLDDTFAVLDIAQRQDVSADPNQTVQSFIDLCGRHQDNFYKFVHEVHIHDNGLFTALMGWLEDILDFLRHGPKGGKLDMNALFQGAVDMHTIDKDEAIQEIDELIRWQEERKKWHQDKTRQKMAAEGTPSSAVDLNGGLGNGDASSPSAFRSSDFGLDETAMADLASPSESEDEADDAEDGDADPLSSERRRRAKVADKLKRTAGEPVKPEVKELNALKDGFCSMLRMVLAD